MLRYACLSVAFLLLVLHSLAPATRPGPDDRTITGVVLDKHFRPIANARVAVVQTVPRSSRTVSVSPGVTDVRGRFSMELPAPVDELRLRVTASGFAPILDWGRRAQSFRLIMPRAIPTPVRVVDGATGEPVPEAVVRTFLLGLTAAPGAIPFERVTTDAEGRARVDLAEGEATVLACAPDFAPTSVKVQVGKEASPVEVALGPGATIRGRVRDPSGKPVAGVQLTLSALPWFSETRRTDASGGFFFTHVPRGKNAAPC